MITNPSLKPFTGIPALRSTALPTLRARMRGDQLELTRPIFLTADRLETAAGTFGRRLRMGRVAE